MFRIQKFKLRCGSQEANQDTVYGFGITTTFDLKDTSTSVFTPCPNKKMLIQSLLYNYN